jgi:hypothetical protein
VELYTQLKENYAKDFLLDSKYFLPANGMGARQLVE